MNDLILAIVGGCGTFAFVVGCFIAGALPTILETEVVKEWARNRGTSAKVKEIDTKFDRYKYFIDSNKENIHYLERKCKELENRIIELEEEIIK